MTDKVIGTVSDHGMIPRDSVVGIGFSGGADSTALVHILNRNREKLHIKKLIAVHIHHGIRGDEADRDLNFAKNFCKKLGIEFVQFCADIPAEAKKTGESIEECARRIRYGFFEQIDCDVFATAHNLNDNMETVIMNFSRGSSLTGLCGIPYKRGKYIRPLLDVSRDEIEKYIEENHLEFVTDSTNLCDDYTRNKIRHNVIGQLFEINPAFSKAFSKCIESVNVSNDFIVGEARKLVDNARHDGYFDCTAFSNCHKAVRLQAIMLILKEKKAKNISREHINAVNNIIEKGGCADIGDNITLCVERDKLYFGKAVITENFSMCEKIEEKVADTPIGKYSVEILVKKDLQNLKKIDIDNLIDYDKISNSAVFRNRLDGDSYRIRNRNCTKTLKRLFNDAKIPVSSRSKMLVVADNDEIIWTEYFGVSEKCKITDSTKKYVRIVKVGEND